MRTALWCLAAVVLAGSTGLMATTMNRPPADQREDAGRLFGENNFNDALKIYRELLLNADVADNALSDDLAKAINCMQQLGTIHEADALIEQALEMHPGHFALTRQAAQLYAGGMENGGFVIGGKFERGGHRGGGQWASVEDRDRVRSLQLLLKALDLAAETPSVKKTEKADLWSMIASQIGSAAQSGEAWRLQELTDLKVLPDFEIQGRFGRGRFGWGPSEDKGAPVDADGNPVFHKMPESWDASKSDGERWRWAMAQVVANNEKRQSEVDLSWAGFLQSEFGVSGQAIGAPPVIRPDAKNAENGGENAPKDSGVWAAHKLNDNETIAKLTTGVKRFSLPDEFNAIVILKNVIARKDSSRRQALEMLVNERMNRHQYPQAVELIKVIASITSGDDKKAQQERVKQITGNWIQFESASVFPAGNGAQVEIRYRNGSKAAFEARPIRVEQLLLDVRKYLESDPEEVDWQKTQLENIGWVLLRNDPETYLDAPVAKWNVDLTPPADHFDAGLTVTAPVQKAGAYWITAKMQDGNDARMVIWIADTAITRKRVEDGTLYYVADAVSGAPVANADMEFFGWRMEYGQQRRPRGHKVLTTRFADRTDKDGLCVPAANDLIPQNQWLAIARTKDGRFAFDGFAGIWNPDKLQPLEYGPVKIYSVTDRPVYRPGHDVKYRLWTRKPRFDADDNSYANLDTWVQIRNPKGDIVLDVAAKNDRWAGVDGVWSIPADATLGTYQIGIAQEVDVARTIEENGQARVVTEKQRVLIGGGSFVVEEYRKPEFEVKVDAPEKPVKLGEKIQARINARYYFGAPVAEGKVHYKVERTKKDSRWYPVAQWDWLYSPGYWWFAPEYQWYPRFSHWGCLGPIRPWWNWSPDPPEVVAEGDAEIGADGTYLIDIDTANALANHSDSDHNYSITAEVVDKSRRTIIGTGSVLVARDPFKVFTWTDRGHYQTGDDVQLGYQARTPDGKSVQGTGKVTLYSVSYPGGDQPKETEVQSWDAATNAEGTGSLRFKVPEAGQFRVSVTIKDAEGHEMEGGYVFFVRGQDQNGGGYRFNDLELITEKREYQPGETVRLQINTNKANSTVLLFVRAMNGLCPKPEIIRLDGKSTVYELKIAREDMPNIFVEAVTIANGRIFNEVREIVVPPEQRVANVEVLPSAQKFRPGEEATVKVRLTDLQGKPFVGNTVLSVYDASLEYVAASSIPEIRKFFWEVRRSHHMSVMSTLQRMGQPVHFINETAMQPLFGNDLVFLGSGGPGGPMLLGGMRGGGGGFGGGGMMFKGRAMMAEGAAMGMAAPAAAAPGMVADAMPAPGAPGGDGGGEVAQPAMRSNFADTAWWVASADADDNGIVEVKFKVPDNLTTWKIKVWSMGNGTRVGSGDAEIISSKNLIIRPQTPRFFTERDQMMVSAVVHNYLSTEKSIQVVIENEGGHLKLLDEATQKVTIAAGGEVRVNWLVDVVASGLTTIRMKALADEESDAVEVRVPVQVHGILKTESYTGVIRPNGDKAKIEVRVPEDRIASKSRLEIRYSPSLAGAMVDSLPYLVQYPYGCTEQTLNRFLPAVLTQRTLQKMGVNLADVAKQRTNLDAQRTYLGKYPAHWGQPPQVQTRDLRELPAGFGRGSSTLAKWIQERIDEDAKKMQGLGKDSNPVFDDAQMNRIVREGVKNLSEMQLSDGGWGWFSGYGERSSAHLTAQVVHGLTVARNNDVPILPDVLERGVEWLKGYQQGELAKLREGDKHRENDKYKGKAEYKMQADNLDAFVALVLTEHDGHDPAMTDYLYRDRGDLTAYGLGLTGLVLHYQQDVERRDMVIKNLDQFLVQDEENQTAWLRLPENYWWYWYGSDNEAMAVYLKLLVTVQPEDEKASRLVKYLLNNRKHATYWNSTRDTAMIVEAMAEYIKATGEDQPEMTVEVLVDGQVQKTVEINGQNLFSFDNSLVIEGDAVTTGAHSIEVRRTGKGPVYFSAYLTNFTKEDAIKAAGLEVKVTRKFYRLERDDQQINVQGDRGQLVNQKVAKYKRIPLEDLRAVTSGDLVEVELLIDSKNDYEYLLLEDHKPSGFEPDDQRSGYVWEGLHAYREFRDERVSFFLNTLARGQHSISYRLRAETPGRMNALPATIEGMYSPELVGNSDEFSLRVNDRDDIK